MAAIFDLFPIRTSGIHQSTSVVLPDLENMGIAVGISLLLSTQPKKQVLIGLYVLPFRGRHFDLRHGCLSSVIFVIGGNSAVLKNIKLIIVSLTICLLH